MYVLHFGDWCFILYNIYIYVNKVTLFYYSTALHLINVVYKYIIQYPGLFTKSKTTTAPYNS